MTSSTSLATLIARILLSVLFLIAGLGKLADVQGFIGYMTSGGVPAFLGYPVIALEILGGLAILVGFQTRVAAILLAGFSILSGLMFHFVPADQMQMNMFFKNLGLAGGFLMLAAYGAGTWSVDGVMGRRTVAA